MSSDSEHSAEQPPAMAAAPSESQAELMPLLPQAAKSMGCSKLDDWYLGSGHDFQPCSAPVPFFPDVHEELTDMWKAPYTSSSHLSSSLLTTLYGRATNGYMDVPQVECAVVVHLCQQNVATWRNHPQLPSKP